MFGVFAFTDSEDAESLAVGISPEWNLDGLTLSKFQAYGDGPYDLIRLTSGSEIPVYGTKNPLVHKFGNLSAPNRVN